jgi:hypothetical protein
MVTIPSPCHTGLAPDFTDSTTKAQRGQHTYSGHRWLSALESPSGALHLDSRQLTMGPCPHNPSHVETVLSRNAVHSPHLLGFTARPQHAVDFWLFTLVRLWLPSNAREHILLVQEKSQVKNSNSAFN